MMPGRVLIIAGSDSGGGAGIQADLKTVLALGGYGMTAITALTAQNTRGVAGIHPVPTPFVRLQMAEVLDDLGADALKTGMLGGAEVIQAVAEEIAARAATTPLVVDPVMVAKGGARLLDPGAEAALREHLLPRATVLTPNLPEAAVLTGLPVDSETDRLRVLIALRALGPGAVLLKGGHGDGAVVVDLLAVGDQLYRFESPRLETRHTHGTGCTLASAVATGLAQGLTVPGAVARAQTYVHRAVAGAPGLGHGHGPLDHGHPVMPVSAEVPPDPQPLPRG